MTVRKPRGRVSAAAKEIKHFAVAEAFKTVDAPTSLTTAQADVWSRTMRGGNIDIVQPENYDLLIDYCRLVDQSNKLAPMIDDRLAKGINSEEELKILEKLMKQRDQTVRTITTVSTKLRLTPQSRLTIDQANTRVRNAREVGEGVISPLIRPSLN